MTVDIKSCCIAALISKRRSIQGTPGLSEKEKRKQRSNICKEIQKLTKLKVQKGKEERIERLVDEAKKDGDVDKLVSKNLRNKRKDVLAADNTTLSET